MPRFDGELKDEWSSLTETVSEIREGKINFFPFANR